MRAVKMPMLFCKRFVLLIIFSLFSTLLFAQDDILQLLNEQDTLTGKEFVNPAFKTNRIINIQTAEVIQKKMLDVKIAHRFNAIGVSSNGTSSVHNLWGFDESSDIRISFDYGLTDKWNIGFARSKFLENWELNSKLKLAGQRRDNSMPVTITLYGVATYSSKQSINYIFDNPTTNTVFKRRFAFVSQLVFARKFSNRLSLEVTPIYVHRNFVAADDNNEALAIGGGGRFRITKRMSLIADYVYNLGEYRKIKNKNGIYNPLGLGLEFETGGHVFSLMFTNAEAINETRFVTNTVDTWTKGGFRFCFTIARGFNLSKKKVATNL
jgi:hypothetical protein